MDTTWTEYFSLSCYLILHVSCTCLYFIWLEVQKYRRDVTHCSCVTDAPRAQLVAHAHHVGRDCHTIYQSLPQALCQLQSFQHIRSYYIFSPSLFFPVRVTFKIIFVWSWNTLKGQCPCYSFWPEAKEKWLFDNSSNSVWTRELHCCVVPSHNASFQ